MTNHSFLIYDAAAGSGKTFTLVKEYLKRILIASEVSYYKKILAITFTNKAVAEMKSRILENLVAFSEEESIQDPSAMFVQISEETGLPSEDIQQRSKDILKHLLHHYAGFAVETIDQFNHNLIRTFARDLSLATNFEVTLDTDQLLAEAVDQLINKAGTEQTITSVLIDYALEKTDDDKSWDISRDITKASKILYDENEAPHLEKLRDKSVADFQKLKTLLHKKKAQYQEEVTSIAEKTLQTIEEASLENTDFTGGSRAFFPAYLQKLADSNLNVAFGAAWQESMGEKPMYPKTKTTDIIAQTIDALTPQFIEAFEQTKKIVSKIWLYDNMLKNLTPLSVINLVGQELQAIKEEQNVLPISEFNALINKEIKNQPAPFIYERLGERYRHFFIDEFQDTSLLQWENLIPLIDNALSQQHENETPGSLLLVGDAKQSIYRWRGGLPEQFIALTQKIHPFSVADITVENLPTNYRSFTEIVQFNNLFFSSVAKHFGNAMHQHLYEIGNQQKANAQVGGYVHLEFLEKMTAAEKDEAYGQKTLQTIQKLVADGFELGDICVLTRSKKDGISLSGFLMEHDLAVVSSETLLLQYAPVVQCMINTLILSVYPDNDEVKIQILDFLHDHLSISEEKHTFFSAFLKNDNTSFTAQLANYNVNFELEKLNTISVYQSCEYIIKSFNLYQKADAYLYGFLDFVFDFEQQPQADTIRFLDHWETKKASASVATNAGANAVQFMTIHKAKGLEFPVVIFPYANVAIYKEIEAKSWFPIDDSQTVFKEARISFNGDVENFGDHGKKLYDERRDQLELDAFNLLYVTLTRPVEQLYVFAEMPSEKKTSSVSSFSDLFATFLGEQGIWNTSQMLYSFGTYSEKKISEEKQKINSITPMFYSSTPEEHNLKLITKEAFLWQTEAGEAISAGNLFHETMEQIKTTEDIDVVISEMHSRAVIPSETLETLTTIIKKVTTHPELIAFYKTPEAVLNEREIITQDGRLLIPDRLNFIGNKVTIIDYKTGHINEKYEAQIHEYAQALEAMGYDVAEKIIVYTHQDEILVNKV